MNVLVRYLPPIIAINALAACAPTSKEVKMDQPVQVYKGGMTADVTERKPKEIHPLGADGTTALKQYIEVSESKTVGYVLSNYYIKTDTQVIGVVESEGSGLIGLDVTTDDASRSSVTAPHTLLICDDDELASALLKQVKSAVK